MKNVCLFIELAGFILASLIDNELIDFSIGRRYSHNRLRPIISRVFVRDLERGMLRDFQNASESDSE